MKNIELKIILPDFKYVRLYLKEIKAKFSGRLLQVDTYYNCKNGRLKIREINSKQFELIFYQRPDKNKSKISDYQILKLEKNHIESFKNILKESLGEKAIVKKERNLWLYRNTRIHLDKVDDLGNFLELETVVSKISLNNAKKEHQEVIKLLSIGKCKKISKSYSDLLLTK